MRGIWMLPLVANLLAAANVVANQEAYYLDPPSPPYCTPLYLEPDCFSFGRFRPPNEGLPDPRIVLLSYTWLQTPAELIYTPVAQYLGAQGAVEFEVVADSDGRITDYTILSSPSRYLEQAVIHSISTFQVKPGIPGAHRGRVVFSLVPE